MDEEKKVYPIVGKVKISAEEYRDLIEAVAIANREAEKSDAQYWEKYKECREKEDIIKKLKEEIVNLKKFAAYVWGDEERKNAYKAYVAEQRVAELDEEEGRVY